MAIVSTSGPSYRIAHELPGRIRFKPVDRARTLAGETELLQRLMELDAIDKVIHSPLTGSLLIYFPHDRQIRTTITRLVLAVDDTASESPQLETDRNPYTTRVIFSAALLSSQFLVPPAVRMLILLPGCWPFIYSGLQSLRHGRVDSELLNGAAITAAFAIGDYTAAGVIAVLLNLGEYLEYRTKAESFQGLVRAFQASPGSAWIRRDGQELKIPAESLVKGDQVVVRAGSTIPIDGVIVEGKGLVQQATMTGEALALPKQAGERVQAATVLEEGELIVLAEALPNETQFARIAQIIQNAPAFKGHHESMARQMADRLAMPVFLLSLGTLLLTRNIHRAVAVLLVDFSCAMKLSSPLTIAHGLSTGLRQGVLIKGGKALENLARADTFVLDKTGTLTVARPAVHLIKAYRGYDRTFILKQAACLEEHFSHPQGRAIVEAAEQRHLKHAEEHEQVSYKLARGLESRLFGERILVGSRQLLEESDAFDFEICSRDEQHLKQQGYQVVYVALGKHIIGLIALKDPLRKGAKSFVEQLMASGVRQVLLVTGDGLERARQVGNALGIRHILAHALPTDKIMLVQTLQSQGHHVCMVGDGMNDSPALRYANVSITMKDSADLAKESADVIVLNNQLLTLLQARHLASSVMQRVKANLAAIVAVNGSIMMLGSLGLMPPIVSALSHNLATLSVTFNALRPFKP